MLDSMKQYTIYYKPADFPNATYVVRAWNIGPKGPWSAGVLGTADTLDEARNFVPLVADFCLFRSPEDDATIVETWL